MHVSAPRTVPVRLNQIGEVHWHLVDLRRVVLLNVAQNADVIGFDEIDRDAFAAETARAADLPKSSTMASISGTKSSRGTS